MCVSVLCSIESPMQPIIIIDSCRFPTLLSRAHTSRRLLSAHQRQYVHSCVWEHRHVLIEYVSYLASHEQSKSKLSGWGHDMSEFSDKCIFQLCCSIIPRGLFMRTHGCLGNAWPSFACGYFEYEALFIDDLDETITRFLMLHVWFIHFLCV